MRAAVALHGCGERGLCVIAVAAIVFGAGALARDASADSTPAAETVAAAPSRPAQWYDWQILAADGAAVGVAALGGAAQTPVRGIVEGTAFFGYLGDGAVIHSLHGQAGKGAASIILRLVLPVAGLVIGFAAGSAVANAHDNEVGAAYGEIGFLIGMGAASVTDIVALSWGRGPSGAEREGPAGSKRPSGDGDRAGRTPASRAPPGCARIVLRRDLPPTLGSLDCVA